MKLKSFITIIVFCLTVSCETNQSQIADISKSETVDRTTGTRKTATDSPSTVENLFDRSSFPQEYCGDSLPNDPNLYPLELYTVSIKYSETNRKLVASKFCNEAAYDGNGIKVASFIGQERASQFKNLMEREFGSARVGEATVIETKYEPLQTNKVGIEKSNELGKAAGLSLEQIEQVMSIHPKALVPTYVPEGFQVSQLKINNTKHSKFYTILYKNSNNSSFEFTGYATPGGAGGGPVGYDLVKVISPVVGEVILEYTKSSEQHKNGLITLREEFIYVGGHLYEFSSPISIYRDDNYVIRIQDAVKVIESLQYLNH